MKKNKDIKTAAVFDEDGYSDDLGDGPSEHAIIVEDFLPSPEELAEAMKTTKVTLGLDPNSLAFFKRKAKELGVPYQRMIREVITEYANKHQD